MCPQINSEFFTTDESDQTPNGRRKIEYEKLFESGGTLCRKDIGRGRTKTG